jgi:tetratricopeptide (TPR) repeat protein
MEEVLKIKPKDVTLLLQLARLKEKQGKLQEALRTYEKIMAISPEHQGIKETYLGLLLEDAKLKEKQGQTREAMETYKKILDISPGLREAEEAYLRLRFKALEQ